MHLFFERTVNARSDCPVLSLTWMGKVPDEFPEARSEDDPWKLNRKNYYQEGWLATGNVRGIVGITFTTSHCKKNFDFPIRTNYNLRGHRSEVILVKWNEPYQKLASCDSSGIIFVWIKYEGRWSIELINDRNTPVTHFSWSHDGRMALICYQDGFVLVGSVAGQRYWSSMLNLDSTITCGIWTPNDNQVYFGTSSGQIVVMDVHGAMVSQVQLGHDVGITSMAWSCEKFKMEEGQLEEEFFFGQAPDTDERNFVLAVAMQNGYVYLLNTFDDVAPIEINTELQGPLCMEWSSSRECLAIAGVTLTSPSISDIMQYTNMLKFYNEKGVLLYQARIPDTHARVSSITWGHNDLRLFLATGTQVHIAWVVKSIPSLQLLSRIRVHNLIPSESVLTYLPIPKRLRNSVGNLFAQTIRCYVPEPSRIRDFVSRPPTGSVRLHCTMIRHDDENNLSSGTCYTLYLEYLGGLVPLLKGKRTSQLRPDFVIFDPQSEGDPLLPHFPDGHQSSSSSSDSKISYSAATAGIFTDSSDSDRADDGCAGSPKIQRIKRLQRRRKRRQRAHQEHLQQRQQFCRLEQELDAEDLSYVDTLPEQDKLVEVTSNIWGTKFKIHGLTGSVPANLGQVTYKTSLLHLQPRQMTLVITELRDDFPICPDPTFNPNLFSEDEEEPPSEDKSPSRLGMDCPPIAPMSPRTSALSRQKSYLNEDPGEGLERRECKEEGCHVRPQQLRPNSSQNTSFIGHLGKNCPQNQKHAISPICCEVSVPALQSPKNAVAPSDIIFDRPPATYSSTTTSLQVKPQTLSDTSVSSNMSSSDSPISSSSKSSGFLKKLPDKRPSSSDKELKYVEEEHGPSTSTSKNNNPIPAVIEPMMRSCSVGYLDMVDAQLVPNEVRLSMLRKDIPKRLVLVNTDTTESRKRQSRLRSKPNSKNKNFAKSKSLDSSDIFHNESNISNFPVKENKLPEVIEQPQEQDQQEVKKNSKNSKRRELFISPLMRRRNKGDGNSNSRNSRSINNNNNIKQTQHENGTNGERNGISIHTQALANLEKLINRLREDDSRPTPPPSPRLPRSSPSSPAPSKKGARPQSASPIRRKLLNSPLLGRRYKKQKNQESSDDEVNASGDEIFNGTNYKDLETFQKSQLRQKLKRGKIEPNGSCCNTQVIPQRREFVMHNKAPMWNENSQVYQLDFGGRVTQESAKNFQIEFRGKQVMQFGRIDGNAYTLDFQYPFSALQAFAVALANVTQRLK